MSNENLTPRPLNICKQRQSNVVTPMHRFSHENGFAVSRLPPTSCNISIDGRVVAHGAFNQQARKSQIESSSALRRQPSFKHRLLNRMMSGLTTRTQVNDIDEEDEQTENRLSSANTSREPSRGSTASSKRSMKQMNNIDEALAAFPTPPSSNVSSPSSDRSLKSSDSLPRTFASLSRPTQDTALAAELRIVAYQDHAPTDRSVLALVEISTTMNCDLHDCKSHLQQSDLDIAVIIDNSLFNSPSSLMASCEIASLLASFLNDTTDRMAVLCTVPADAQHDNSSPDVILPLGRINLRRLKAKLDSISVATAQRNSGVISTILQDAHQILLNSERPASIGEPPCKRFAHVIILTADASAVCTNDLTHQDIQNHVLCVGFPQQKEWEKVVCNGWKMCMFNAFFTRGRLSQPRLRQDQDPHSLKNSLQRLVQHIRLGKLMGSLTEIVLDIESQSGYSVEEAMGGTVWSKIQIGEVKTVILRLQPVRRPTKPECVDAHRWYHFDTASNGDDLVAVLDQMLGLPKDGTMKANLKYKHSSLPANTTCITSVKCLLRTPLPWLEDKNLARKSISSQAKNLLHQRLARHYATFYEPREALCFLQREFGDGFGGSACPMYIKAIADELKYQARISERISLDNSPRKPSLRCEAPHTGIRIGEECNTPSFYAEGYKPKDWISIPPDEDIFAADALPRPSFTVAEQLGLDDAAGKIWNDLRKMSRGEANNGNGRQQSNLFAAADREARSQRATRRMMAKMKGRLEYDQERRRSIGNGSVSGSSTARRSLSMPVRRSSIRVAGGASGAGGGLSAPWL